MKKQQIFPVIGLALLLSSPIYGMLRSSSRLALSRASVIKSCSSTMGIPTRSIIYYTDDKTEKMIEQEIVNQKEPLNSDLIDESLHKSVHSLEKHVAQLSADLSKIREEYSWQVDDWEEHEILIDSLYDGLSETDRNIRHLEMLIDRVNERVNNIDKNK